MAAYGDLFLRQGEQGTDDELSDLSADQIQLAAALAAEWLTRAAQRPEHPDASDAAMELTYLDKDGYEEQGRRQESARTAVNGLSLPPSPT